MDKEGNKIEATMFNDEVQSHGSILSVGRYYNFSDGRIRFIDPAFRVVQNDYQMILNRGSKIEEVIGEDTYEANLAHNFVALSDVGKFLYEGFEIDIIAVVLDVSPIRHVTRHIDNAKVPICDLLIVDQSLQPIYLSVWNDLATNECKQITSLFPGVPVIIATHIKVQAFKGISLSTRSLTTITVNPDTECAKDIQSRCILRLQITDDTFSTWVTLFGPNAERLLACTANQLRDDGSFRVLAASALNKKFTFHVTSSDETYQNRRGKRLNVIGIDEVCPPSQNDENEDPRQSKRPKIAQVVEKGEEPQSKQLKIDGVSAVVPQL